AGQGRFAPGGVGATVAGPLPEVPAGVDARQRRSSGAAASVTATPATRAAVGGRVYARQVRGRRIAPHIRASYATSSPLGPRNIVSNSILRATCLCSRGRTSRC